jgi:hypothetical protein
MKTNQTRKDMYIDVFGRWLMYIDHNGMNEKQSIAPVDFIQLEH